MREFQWLNEKYFATKTIYENVFTPEVSVYGSKTIYNNKILIYYIWQHIYFK